MQLSFCLHLNLAVLLIFILSSCHVSTKRQSKNNHCKIAHQLVDMFFLVLLTRKTAAPCQAQYSGNIAVPKANNRSDQMASGQCADWLDSSRSKFVVTSNVIAYKYITHLNNCLMKTSLLKISQHRFKLHKTLNISTAVKNYECVQNFFHRCT